MLSDRSKSILMFKRRGLLHLSSIAFSLNPLRLNSKHCVFPQSIARTQRMAHTHHDSADDSICDAVLLHRDAAVDSVDAGLMSYAKRLTLQVLGCFASQASLSTMATGKSGPLLLFEPRSRRGSELRNKIQNVATKCG